MSEALALRARRRLRSSALLLVGVAAISCWGAASAQAQVLRREGTEIDLSSVAPLLGEPVGSDLADEEQWVAESFEPQLMPGMFGGEDGPQAQHPHAFHPGNSAAGEPYCPHCGDDVAQLDTALHLSRDFFCHRCMAWLFPERRHQGVGQPLMRGSWRNYPLSAGWLMGAVWGDELRGGRVDQNAGFIGGFRLGWDWHHYWGAETRFAFASPDVENTNPPQRIRGNDMNIWDFQLLYYPLGDARWRPYVSVGLGLVTVDFEDERARKLFQDLLGFPIALGVKYRWSPRIVLRMEVSDMWTSNGGVDVDHMNTLMLTGGMEARFGGRRKSYWPWHPSRHWW